MTIASSSAIASPHHSAGALCGIGAVVESCVGGTRQDRADAPELGKAIRSQFPIFAHYEKKHAQPLHFLDSAASAQKPAVVIDRLSDYLRHEHANVHRGAYGLSAAATEHYEAVRKKVADFIGAGSEKSIVFTRGTTESINLVARSLERFLMPGDVVLIPVMEHHSNIVPWQLLAERRGLKLCFVPMGADAAWDGASFRSMLREYRPRLVAVTHVANSFGTVVPIASVIEEAHAQGALVLIDAAQSAAHRPLDVSRLGCDFLAFSGHKLYGPTGAGVLYVRPDRYDIMEPVLGGGDMIRSVSTAGSTWAEPPYKFEAGTPPIAEVIALGSAIDFVRGLEVKRIQEYESSLLQRALEKLAMEPGVTVYGPGRYNARGVRVGNAEQCSIVAFNVDGVHPHDLATVADNHGVQIRAGHHCAMPALRELSIASSARASLGVYSCMEDIEALCESIRHARQMFR